MKSRRKVNAYGVDCGPNGASTGDRPVKKALAERKTKKGRRLPSTTRKRNKSKRNVPAIVIP